MALAPNRRQAVIWTSYGLVYWRIYAPLGLNELNNAWQRERETYEVLVSKSGTQIRQIDIKDGATI